MLFLSYSMKHICFRMYVIHITTIYLFYFGVLYFIYNNVEMVRFFLDYVTEKIKSLPFIRESVDMMQL